MTSATTSTTTTTTIHAKSATHAHARSTVTQWTISGVGMARILYGGILLLALPANGFAAGTGFATAAVATTGVEFVIQGIATTALANVLTRSYIAVTISVALDALVTVLAMVLLAAGWNQLTAAGGLAVLGAVAVATISAVIVALTSTSA
ncbi:hypothetical protein [Prescottella agglutinans]|uniref:Uncharacterized protein n=1 Tax=Prescottella agglutinans TaxID=1644129 RepID=A0ABT6M4J4_9NOCA|nr:hypothetical protein [Prescottella agglutinans]MDH6279223.1 hypothetical protein [Prescottella agglutinans]